MIKSDKYINRNIINYILLCFGIISPQQLTYDFKVINIEVPVRVFQGDKFMDNLNRDDFTLLEDGIQQNIEAVYLIKRTTIDKKDEKAQFRPNTARYFYMMFSLYEYNPKIRTAIDYFYKEVLRPEDRFMIITPRAVYNIKKEIRDNMSVDKAVDQIYKYIRKDIVIGETAYRAVLNDLKRMVGFMGIERQSAEPDSLGEEEYDAYGSGSIDEYLNKFKSDVEDLERLRNINEEKLFQFAKSLKEIDGHKIVYLFYQKEFIPKIPKNLLEILNGNQILKPIISDLFENFSRRISFNTKRLKEEYSNSEISFYFSYMTGSSGVVSLDQMQEHSEDAYSVFNEIAKATGGSTTSSANPEYLMQQASREAENYYLIYYSPKNKEFDGKYRNILVEIKNKSYRVSHKSGYYAK